MCSCSLEAPEPGRIEGGEDGIADTADLEGKLTAVEQVKSFIETGINFLAPAFGNVHGEYGARGPLLEFDRYVLRSAFFDLELTWNDSSDLMLSARQQMEGCALHFMGLMISRRTSLKGVSGVGFQGQCE